MKDSSVNSYRLQRPGMALMLLGCLFVLCLIIAGVLMAFIPLLLRDKPEAILRISAVVQDLFVFIIPAVGMAMVITRLPARLLAVEKLPDMKSILISIGILIVSIPAMNLIIQWNQNWHLPESMASVEEYFRALEQNASDVTEMLLTNATIPSLIVSILIVGVLAGFSEELFFRGALQRVLTMTRINHHVVIWLVAVVFSAFHFQLFGFVPRMLLGAFFGYALYWSGSLWLPVILHIFNNTLVVVASYNKPSLAASQAADSVDAVASPSLDTIGSTLSTPLEIVAVILSLILVIYGIWLLRRHIFGKIGIGVITALCVSLCGQTVSAKNYEYSIDSETTLHMETVGEYDLDTYWDFGEDADANNHNIFILGDKIYLYVQDRQKHHLKSFDLQTLEKSEFMADILSGITFEDTDGEEFSRSSNSHSILSDDAGNICLVSVYTNTNLVKFTPGQVALKVHVCAFRNGVIDDNSHEETYYTEKIESAISKVDQFVQSVEINAIRGDAYAGNFEVEIDGIHIFNDVANNDQNDFYVGKMIICFKNHNLKSKDYISYASSELGDYENYLSNKEAKHYNLFNIIPVTDDIHIVQRHKKTSPLLFVNTGKEESDYPCFSQVDRLSEFEPEDGEAHYGAYPFTIGGETFLLNTRRTYSESGPKFVLSHWKGEKSSFEGLNKVWEFPEEGNYELPTKIYDMARPKVAIVSDDGSGAGAPSRVASAGEKLKVCTYVPGSALGVYNLSVVKNSDITSGTGNVIVDDDTTSFNVSVDGNSLTFNWVGGKPSCLKGKIIGMDGKIHLQFQGEGYMDGADISGLPSGVYIAEVNGHIKRFCLRR